MNPILVGVAIWTLLAGTAHAQGMLDSKHNLSVAGPGTIKAVEETRVCVFCHTPHNANPAAPLWNRELSGATYTPYASGSLQATVGQPNGYSRLCLSCHDGTIAIGKVHNIGGQSATINVAGTGPGGVLPPGPTLIGTSLANDHPVSFVFDSAAAAADGELVSPISLTGPIRLYEGANAGIRDSVQCTTCHDPHVVVNPKFLKKSLTGRADNLCLTCHDKPGWVNSSHESATTKFFPAGSGNTVADLSCGACHHPHTKQGAPRLLKEGATDAGAPAIELACYQCHTTVGEGGITFDLKTQFAKPRRHPIADFQGHEPIFTVATPTPEPVLNNTKHVECTDCHNPHRVTAANKFEGMRGIDLAGTTVQDVTQNRDIAEHEICLRCHGDSYITVIGTVVSGDPTGTIPTSNKRTEFQTTNSAFHPVAGPGRNSSQNLNDQLAPNGLSTSSVIKCSDCHNNNFYSGPSFNGVVSQYTSTLAEPKGPHGSSWFNLLRARVWNVLPGPSNWSSTNFDLCFQCHDVTRLTARRFEEGARTNFDDEGDPPEGKGKDNLHWFHLVKVTDKARPICKSCHYNIHSNVEAPNSQYRINGILFTTPPSGTPTRLVNFHPNILPIGGRLKPEWEFNTVTKERRCWLQCHRNDGTPGGPKMNGFGYRPPFGDLP
ncbi:MAG: cytochrome c3 family protein [Candidatus Methylomirabilia bacterium]